MQDAYVEVSRETSDAGALKMHVVAGMLFDPTLPVETQIKLLKELRQSADRDPVKPTAIKILLDGVASTYSAAMLEPCSDREADPATGALGGQRTDFKISHRPLFSQALNGWTRGGVR